MPCYSSLPNLVDILITPFGDIEDSSGSLNSPKNFRHCTLKEISKSKFPYVRINIY